MLRQRGVSLMELMVAVGVLGVLVAAGAPALADLTRNARVRTVAETWRDGLAQARIEATRRNQRVDFTPDGLGYEVAGRDADDEPVVLFRWAGAEAADTVAAELLDAADAAFDGRGELVPADVPFRADFAAVGADCRGDGGEAVCLRLEAVNGFLKVCDPALPVGAPKACELEH